MAKIYEITGEGPKPKSKPKPRPPPPTVKTVNEIPSEEDVSIWTSVAYKYIYSFW